MQQQNKKQPQRLTPTLRSVSVSQGIRLERLPMRSRSLEGGSIEEPHLTKALKANEKYIGSGATSTAGPDTLEEEEYLLDFLRWSSRQSVALLPRVTQEQPLLPTRIVIPAGIPLQRITQAIAGCLQRAQEKGVLFGYSPHPDHAGRMELGSLGCHLKFVIQLWRHELTEDDGDETCGRSGGVVVELQRRRGCCVLMHHLRRPLFKALAALSFEYGKEQDVIQPQHVQCTRIMLPAAIRALPDTGALLRRATAVAPGLIRGAKVVDGGAELAFPPPLRLPSF